MVIPAVLALVAGLIVAKHASLRAMCETARAAGLNDVRRDSVLWSLGNAPP